MEVIGGLLAAALDCKAASPVWSGGFAQNGSSEQAHLRGALAMQQTRRVRKGGRLLGMSGGSP